MFFVTSGAPGRLTDASATYGFNEAFNFGYPNLGVAAMMTALPLMIPLVILLMRRVRAMGGAAMSIALAVPAPARASRSRYRRRRLWAKLGGVTLGIVLLIWTLLPVYNMVLIALDFDADEFTGSNPGLPIQTSQVFARSGLEDYWLLEHFWHRFGNSIYMGVMTMLLTVLLGSLASFSLGRMRLRRSWLVTDFALLTYVLPTTFLVIPFVHIMHQYGMVDSLWSVIAAMVAFATPYAILILHQYGKLIPMELDELAKMDGASPLQIYLRVYLPLMAPALVGVGIYALLLAWNESSPVPAAVIDAQHDCCGRPRSVL